jgi:hypothetical protein
MVPAAWRGAAPCLIITRQVHTSRGSKARAVPLNFSIKSLAKLFAEAAAVSDV